MRYTPVYPEVAIHQMLDPRSMVRWVWVGRVALACSILIAAVFVWDRAEPLDTLVATLAFAIATLATIASAIWAEVYRRPLGRPFYGMQCAVDLLLVTAIVHITGGWSSQFAALYILVIAGAALMLPFRTGLMVAAGACVLYAVDVIWLRPGTPHVGVGVQLGVFVVVALGSGFIAARLRQAGVGRDALAAQLVKVQLEAADILRTIRSGILTVDSQGLLLYANPAASELLGMHLRSLVGRPVLQALNQVAPHLADLLERSAREGVRTNRAEGLIRRDGQDIQIGVTTTTAEASHAGSRTTATAIFQDISDTKRLQAMHVRAERLEAVAELSASLAHEIKNPLASIRSATEQLARRHAARPRPGDTGITNGVGANGAAVNGAGAHRNGSNGNGTAAHTNRLADAESDADDERVLHALVVREADRLSRLLSEFLDFARARVTRVAPVDVGAIARTAAQLATAHPDRAAGVDVKVAVSPEALTLDGDEDLLHRAVFNLVLNAVQAASTSERAEGHVHVDVRIARGQDGTGTRRLAALPDGGDAIAIAVSDDGAGIPPELRDRLFEPFVTSKIGGSGLGLPIVHRAVEAHRGVVLVDALEPGTRFTILLPCAPTSATGGAVTDPRISSRISGAVL